MRSVHGALALVVALGAFAAGDAARAESRLFTVRTTDSSVTIVQAFRNGAELPVAGFNDADTVFRIENKNGTIPCANRLDLVTSDGRHIDASVNLCSSNWDLTVSVSAATAGDAGTSPPAETPPAQESAPAVVQPLPPPAAPAPQPTPVAPSGPPMQWSFTAQNDTVTVSYGTADGSQWAFVGQCKPGNPNGTIELAPEGLAPGASVPVSFQAGALVKSYAATTQAVGGAVRPVMLVPLGDPLWAALIREHEVTVAVGNGAPYTLSLSGSAARVRQFLSACNPPPVVVQPPPVIVQPPPVVEPPPYTPPPVDFSGPSYSYVCGDGTQLEISIGGSSAAVSENGAVPMALFAAGGDASNQYYRGGAAELNFQGASVIWNNGYNGNRFCRQQ